MNKGAAKSLTRSARRTTRSPRSSTKKPKERLQLLDRRAVGDDLVERLRRRFGRIETGRLFAVTAWQQTGATAEQEADATTDDATSAHAVGPL